MVEPDNFSNNRNHLLVRIIEQGISDNGNKGYFILQVGLEKVVSIAIDGKKIYHHCKETSSPCTHLNFVFNEVLKKQIFSLKESKIIHVHTEQRANQVLAELIIAGQLVPKDPFIIMRALSSISHSRLEDLLLSSIVNFNENFLDLIFKIMAILTTEKKNKKNERILNKNPLERLLERLMFQVKDDIRRSKRLCKISADFQNKILAIVSIAESEIQKKLIEENKRFSKEIWRYSYGVIAEKALKARCIDLWNKKSKPSFSIDFKDLLFIKATNQEEYVSNRIHEKFNFFNDLLEGRIPNEEPLKQAIRRVRDPPFLRFLETIGGKITNRRIPTISFDDFFIYLMELKNERPIYDLPIRRYHENVYIPMKLLEEFPTLEFIVKRIRNPMKEYITYDEIRNHLKFFKWLGGEPLKSKWDERPKRRREVFADIPMGQIIQWDIISTPDWGDILIFHDREEILFLSREEALWNGVEPFDYTFCQVDSDGKVKIHGVLDLKQLEKFLRKGMKIRSNLLPWHLINDSQIQDIVTINQGIMECKKLDFIMGSDLLLAELNKIVEEGMWKLDLQKYLSLYSEMKLIKEEAIKRKLAEKVLLFFPPAVQHGLQSSNESREQFLERVFEACVSTETFQEVAKLLVQKRQHFTSTD